MFDSALRPLIDPALNAMGRSLALRGISANALTLTGLLVGVGAGAALAGGAWSLGLGLILLNRLFDGLDGAVARVRGKTDFGGYLDILADYVFYAAVPVGFAVADPANALAAAILLASFLFSGSSFLGYAVIAERRRLVSTAQGEKSFYYMAGIAEGTETIAVFIAAALRPDWFAPLALGYALLCVITGFARLALGWRHFR
jgi:phosphatidylglycerophosphate synthase